MVDLLFRAYGLIDPRQISGPGWLETERYDVVATMPPAVTKEQFEVMMQSLLAERFRLRVRHETKDLPVFELVVGTRGHKLNEIDQTRKLEGFPTLPPGQPGMAMRMDSVGTGRLLARQQTMVALARMLRSPAGRLVIDKTGLTGKYDFTLEANVVGVRAQQPETDPGPDIFTAVQQQLGLKLEDRKAPFDIILVDQVERVPSEN